MICARFSVIDTPSGMTETGASQSWSGDIHGHRQDVAKLIGSPDGFLANGLRRARRGVLGMFGPDV